MIENQAKPQEEKKKPPDSIERLVKERAPILRGMTIKTHSPFGTVYTTINENSDQEPFELFCNVGKAGSDICADAEALGRCISLLLRTPSPVSGIQRLRELQEHLSGIGGSKDHGFGPNRVRSVPDAIAKALGLYLEIKNSSARS
jgi:ribonucleoside-diphosphate reductase alpha chain